MMHVGCVNTRFIPAALGLILGVALMQTAVAEIPGGLQLAEADAAARAAEDTTDDSRNQWNERESKLLEALETVFERVSQESPDPDAADWSHAKANVSSMLYNRASAPGVHSEWPSSQLSWVQSAKRNLERSAEKDKKVHINYTSELKILDGLAESLNNESEKTADAAEDEDKGDAAKEGDDENVWKFRDGTGARTTKPRYKGQKPLN